MAVTRVSVVLLSAQSSTRPKFESETVISSDAAWFEACGCRCGTAAVGQPCKRHVASASVWTAEGAPEEAVQQRNAVVLAQGPYRPMPGALQERCPRPLHICGCGIVTIQWPTATGCRPNINVPTPHALHIGTHVHLALTVYMSMPAVGCLGESHTLCACATPLFRCTHRHPLVALHAGEAFRQRFDLPTAILHLRQPVAAAVRSQRRRSRPHFFLFGQRGRRHAVS